MRDTYALYTLRAHSFWRALSTLTLLGLTGLFGLSPSAHADIPSPKPRQVEPRAKQADGVPHPFFWELTGPRGERGYFVGTVHVPDERWDRFPPSMLNALDSADALYTEIDFKDKAAMTSALMSRATLPAGKTLREVIGEAMFNRLDAHLKTYGKSAFYMNSFHPKMVEVMLGLMELMPLLQSGRPALDEWLVQRAQKAGKITGGIETLQEQVDALLGGTLEESVTSLEFTLRKCEADRRELRSSFKMLLKVYFTGDADRVDQFIKSELKGAPPALLKSMDRLLGQRNRVMAERIIKLFKSHPKRRMVFAFGVAHFVGSEGVVSLLEKRGYRVKRRFAPSSSQSGSSQSGSSQTTP